MKPLFTSRRVARVKMCILQGVSRLIVGFDVQDVFLCESLSFENYCFKERFISLSDWFRQWTLLWGGTCVTFFNKSYWDLWNFLLYTLGVKKCISLLLFREHGEINYFLSIIHKLLLLLNITIIIIYYFRLSTYDSRLSTCYPRLSTIFSASRRLSRRGKNERKDHFCLVVRDLC